MDFRHETKRFGQGIEVDRLHPHIFHRDYWTLLHIRQAVERFLHENAASFRGKTALDYGCGVSPYRELFRTYHLSLLRADVDPVEPDVLKINKYTGSLPLEDEAVEAVVSTQVLEHVADVRTYLREAWRVLQPGGRMLCTTHGAAILHRAPVDLRRWTVDGLKYELEQAGFVVERIEPLIGILAFATHLRAIAIAGATHRIPGTGFLRPIIYFLANVRMWVEDMITPRSVMEAHPELLAAFVRKPER